MASTSNTFGTSTKRVRLVDPRTVRTNRIRFTREPIKELSYANSLYVPLGRAPTRGWILLSRKDYDSVRGYGTAYQLEIDQFDATAPAMTFSSLAIVQARSVSTGLSDSQEAVYLVELTDQRGLLANKWWQTPTNSYYNVLSPAYPALYYSQSLNAGSPWTWGTMIGALWAQMSDQLGSFPGLGSTPDGVPTNWSLPGVSAWEAMNQMLTHIGMGVSCDLTLAEPYGIVELGSADATFEELTSRYSYRLEDDLEYIDLGSGRVPGSVVVYFRRVNEYYGTEETVRRDSLQWATNAVYSVTVNSPAVFSGAVGVGFIYDDFPVRYDVDGSPLAADVTTANTIAAERVEQFFDDIYSRTLGYMSRTYAGVLPFYAGSNVDGVCWRQDFRMGRAGWRTQVIRGKLWDEIY